MERLRLAKSEEEVMELFWKENKPLTSIQISELLGYENSSGKYIHKVLRSLQKKGLIEVCGALQYGTQYARQFKLSITAEEFTTRAIISQGFSKYDISKIAVSLVKESNKDKDNRVDDELIAELEKMIEELRMRKD